MSLINLAFTPGVEFVDFSKVGTAGTAHTLPMELFVDRKMLHRRLYLWLGASAGSWTISGFLKFYLAGQVVGNMKFVQSTVANVNVVAFGVQSGTTANTIDILSVQLNSTAVKIAPFNFIIDCDRIRLEGDATLAPSGVPIQYMACLSQNYW